MKIAIEHLSRIGLLIVTGDLVGDVEEELCRGVRQILDDGSRLLIVDLGGSRKVDSEGLGSLIKSFIEFKKQGEKFVLVMPRWFFDAPQGFIHPTHPICDIYQSREEAIEALRKPDPAPAPTPVPAPIPAKPESPRDSTGCLIAGAVFLLGSLLTLVVTLLRLLFHLIGAGTP
jgi:hypothetical protein